MLKEKALQRNKFRSLRLKEKYKNETAAWDAARNFLTLFPNVRKKNISAYWPTGGELDTKPLLSTLNEKGASLLLPKINNNSLVFKKWHVNDQLCNDEKNILSPLSHAKILEPEIIIVPLVAYDIKGNRLGQGGGYYDQYALKNPKKLFVGFCYFIQKLDVMPREKHDMILNYLITERTILKF